MMLGHLRKFCIFCIILGVFFNLAFVDHLKVDNQLDDRHICSMDELDFVYLTFVFQEAEVVVEFLHHPQQLVLAGVLTSIVVIWLKGTYPSHYKINIACFNCKLRCHRPKSLDSNKAISISVWESILHDGFDDRYETLSFLSHRILELINFFHFILHFFFKLLKELLISCRISLFTWFAFLLHLSICFLLLPQLHLLKLCLLLSHHLLV